MRSLERAILELESIQDRTSTLPYTNMSGAAFVGYINAALFMLNQAKALQIKHPGLEPKSNMVDELIHEVNRDIDEHERETG